jgi:hypothetical protein
LTNQNGIKKRRLHADFKTILKRGKNAQTKVIRTNVTEICIFSIFTHVRQIGLLKTLCAFLYTFSKDLHSA